MIRITKPYIVQMGPKSRLVSDLEIDGAVRPLWVEVNTAFEWHLVSERSDAFLVGLLYWAVREGHDIACDAPVDADLLYGVRNLLIPALTPGGKRTKRIAVAAPVTKDPIKNAGAVGTDVTCGVDSLYTIYTRSGNKDDPSGLTHLLYNTIGAHGVGPETSGLYAERLKTAKSFAMDYGLPLVSLDTNLMEIVKVPSARNNIYAHCFAAYALGRLFKRYFVSGHWDDSPKKPVGNPQGMATSEYTHLLLRVFSTRNLSFARGCGNVPPLERIKVIFRNPLTFRYLNVCVSSVRNCTECTKCVRALLRLDALGLVDKCDTVFNLEIWRQERFKHIVRLFVDFLKRKPYAVELSPHFRTELFLLGAAAASVLVCFVSLAAHLVVR